MFLLIMCFAVRRKLINIIWMHELNHLLLQSVPTLWTWHPGVNPDQVRTPSE